MKDKRTVGMTLRFTVEEHEQFVKTSRQMGFKHFSEFVRGCVGTVVSKENELVDHSTAQAIQIDVLLKQVQELKDESSTLEADTYTLQHELRAAQGQIQSQKAELKSTNSARIQMEQHQADIIESQKADLDVAKNYIQKLGELVNRPLLRIIWDRLTGGTPKKKG